MRLFIAEKPSMGMDIAKALNGTIVRGNGSVTVGSNVVTWCIGHLVRQAEPDEYDQKYKSWDVALLPFIPEKWLMLPSPKTREQLKVVGQLIKQADEIVNCGDAAREGQLIVDEMLDYFGYRGPTKRLWLQAMNTAAIQLAIKNMVDNRQKINLYRSALARSRADYLMGMNLTRGYTHAWDSKGNDQTIVIGRVQTPLLCMLVERDLAIEGFKPKPYYTLAVTVRHAAGAFDAAWVPDADAPYLDADGHVTDPEVPRNIEKEIRNLDAMITRYQVTPQKRYAPLPFSLGGLQKACFNMMGLSPDDTLKIAQALYEKHKLTSYPRTDYSHLPEDEHKFGQKIVECAMSNFGAAWNFAGTPDYSLKSAAWNSAKIGDHHGLRPTETRNYNLAVLSKTELAVYRLIVRNFLAQFYPPYQFESTVVELNCEGYVFKTTGAVPKHSGWRVLFGVENEDDDDNDKEQKLPVMAVGDDCKIVDTDCAKKHTEPPSRFTSASLLGAMENASKFVVNEQIRATSKDCGMGTPATRSKIITKLLTAGYAEEVKEGKRKVFISTATGRMLYQAVPEQMRVPDLTAYFESLLNRIEKGELSMEDFMAHQIKFVTKLIDDVKSGAVAAQMPDLSSVAPPERKAARSTGASRTSKTASGTSRAASGPRASGGEKRSYGKPTPRAGDDAPKMVCVKCGSAMVQRSNGAFWGCTGYPNCRHTENIGSAPKSPSASGGSGVRREAAPARPKDDDHGLAF